MAEFDEDFALTEEQEAPASVDVPEVAGTPENEAIVNVPDVDVQLNPDFDNEDGDVTLSIANHEDVVLPSSGSSVTLPAEVAELVLSSPAAVKAD